MPRFERMSAAREREELTHQLGGPRFTVVRTSIDVVVRNDTGRECPISGDQMVRVVGQQDDLTVVIDKRKGKRRNSWDIMTPGEREAFESVVASAEPAGTKGARATLAPIVYRCNEEHVQDLTDDTTEVIYWSGGWRSGKSFLANGWWTRGWVKFGGGGERFWIAGTKVIHAWRALQRIFYGRKGTPPILPLGPDRTPFLAVGIPAKFSIRDLSFAMIDGSLVELYHASDRGGAMEGESVRRILYEEASRTTSADAFDVMRSRVMQTMGQIGIPSVPDDSAQWLFEKVVVEAQRQQSQQVDPPTRKLIEISAFDNPHVPLEAAQRMYEGETDPIVREQKVMGRWARRGLYAYGDCWDEDACTRDELSHSADAWGYGPDITSDVMRLTCKAVGKYAGGVDFNEDPQTRILAKVFGELADWRTWKLVILDEVISKGDPEMAARELHKRKGGVYRGAVLVADANGFHAGHRYGGRALKTYDAHYYRKHGFKVVAPIKTYSKDRKSVAYSNPQQGESRTVVRYLMRNRMIVVNAGAAPRIIHAVERAPNRRKRNNDAGSWLDREIYNLEDSLRYLCWRVFSEQLRRSAAKYDEDEVAA